jgi:protease IV
MHAQRWGVAALTLMLGVLTAGTTGCQPAGGVKISLVPANRTLEETTAIRERAMAPKIAVVEISGLLVDQPVNTLLSEGENPVSLVQEQLKKAEEDSSVQAVILRINSPGGTVTASEMIHEEVQRFKAKTHKPVVSVMLDVTASGGYYVACASDRLFAYPTTITGSIGVIMQLFSFQGSLESIHMKTYAIKSGPFKDAGSPLRDLTPAEREYFDTIVQQFYGRFLGVVKAGRPHLTAEQIKTLADGKVYTADQALAAGLIDEIGSLYTAIAYLKKTTNHPRMNVVVYHRPQEWKPNIYAGSAVPSPRMAQASPVQLNMSAVEIALRPKFLYLWAPGLTPAGQ